MQTTRVGFVTFIYRSDASVLATRVNNNNQKIQISEKHISNSQMKLLKHGRIQRFQKT